MDTSTLVAVLGTAQAAPGPGRDGEGAIAFLGILALWLTVKTGFVGMALWLEAAFPSASQRTLEIYREKGKKCWLVGLLNLVAGALVVFLLLVSQILAPLGILLALFMGVLTVQAFAAGYRNLGARIVPGQSPYKTTLLGGLAAEAAFFAPVLGLLLAFGVCVRGFGAAVLSLMNRRQGTAAEPEPETPELAEE